jgi:DMSO/TMAO reductase YedYZ molybdopterin-dependent catalytic subunit
VASRASPSTEGRPGWQSRTYFWKTAKRVRGLPLTPDDESGFWEPQGYHNHEDPWLEPCYQGD